MKTESISTLKIHKLTQAQYDRELAAGNIDENALYLTPDEAVDSSVLDAHMEDTDKHVTSGEKTNWNAAKTHADSAHAPSNAQANVIESISVNGTKQTIANKAVNITVPTDNKDLANGAGYLVASNIANKADKATTLSGYGITNAYTKTEVDGKIDGAKSDMTQEIASAIDEITPSSIGAATSSHTHDYAASSHTHDDRYFTESEINTKLGGYSTTSHTHSDYASKDHTHNYAASDHTHSYIPTSEKGAKSGVATLDTNGKVPSSQLPSYVDDVIEGYYYNSKFYKESAHTTEIAGETGKIYIDLSSSKTYRWSGSAYAVISETLALGETSSTAYAGNKGKANADAITALQTQVGTGNVTERITSALSEANEYTNIIAESALAITDANDAETLASANAYTDEKLKGKSDTNHTHNYAGSSTAGGAATSANKVNKTLTVKLNSGTTEGTNMFTFDGSTAKSVNITPSSIGASASGHTHDYASSTHTHDYAPSNHSHSNYATTTGVTQEIASAIGEITPESIGAAVSSHGTHVSYGTSAPVMDGTASVGSASTVARSDHKHPTDTSRASASDLTALQSVVNGKLDKTTYEYNKELAIGSSGKVCIGKFPMYDSNISVEIKSTTSTTYNGTLVIATQNINTSGGGSYTCKVYGDADNSLTDAIKIHYGSGSNVFSVYIDLPAWSKNLLHIQCVSLASAPSDIATTVSSIPSTATIVPTNALKTQLDTKAASSHTHSGYAASSHTHSDYATKTAVTQEITSAVGAITPASIGAAASSHGTHVSYGTSATAIGATASAGSASTVSRSDHTHSLSKAAVTAALGYTPPTSDTNTTYSAGTGLTLSGTTFSLADSGVEADGYGQTGNTSVGFGDNIAFPYIVVDAKGRITSAASRMVTLPSTLSNGTGTAGLIKTTSTVTSNSGYTACPVINGVPYYKDTDTKYTHPSYTAKSSGLYKITVDSSGHVSATTAVAKSDITALGIPAQDTTYTLGSFGITATAAELNYCDGVTSNIQTQLNGKAATHSHPYLSTSGGTLSGALTVNSNITNSGYISTSSYIVTEGIVNCRSNMYIKNGSQLRGHLSGQTGATNSNTVSAALVGVDSSNRVIVGSASNGSSSTTIIQSPSRIVLQCQGVTDDSVARSLHFLGYSSSNSMLRVGKTEAAYLGGSDYRWLTIYSKNALNTTSDFNKKENIEAIPQKYIDMLDDITPVIFKFKNGDRLHGGYISQWVEESMNKYDITAEEFGGFCKDQKLDENENPIEGEYSYSLRYSEFIPIIHAKVKQVEERYDKQIEELNLKLAELEAKLN